MPPLGSCATLIPGEGRRGAIRFLDALVLALFLGILATSPGALRAQDDTAVADPSPLEQERQQLLSEIEKMHASLDQLGRELAAAIESQNPALASEIEKRMVGVKADLAGTQQRLEQLPPPLPPPPLPPPGQDDPAPEDGVQDPGSSPGQEPGQEPGSSEDPTKPTWPRPGEPFRVRVRIAGREFYVNSATRTLGEARQGDLRAPSGGATMRKLLGRLPEANPVSQPVPSKDAHGARLAAPVEAGRPDVAASLARHIEPVNDATPDSAFTDLLQARLDDVPAGALQVLWGRYREEPDTLGPAVRLENALVRHVLATGADLADAAPEEASQESAGGESLYRVVRGFRPVALRRLPWGEKVAEVPAGTSVELLGSPRGAWVRVRTEEDEGYLPGLWLRRP